MILLVIVSLFLYQVFGDPIIGAKISEIYRYPWVVSIQRDGCHKCGGSIISNTTILTAAHCTKHPLQSYVVRVGSTRTDSGGTWHNVVAIKRHENYYMAAKVFTDMNNDVALMKVSPPMEIGRYGALIQLVEQEYFAAPGTNVSVAGWGLTSEGGEVASELRSTKLHIVDSEECSRNYGDESGILMKSGHHICASELGKGICYGDSGSPLVTEDDIQVGIVIASLGCGEYKHPGIYEDVAYHRDWIDKSSRSFES